MLILLTELTHRGSSDPWEPKSIGVNPEEIKLVEPPKFAIPGYEDKSCLMYLQDSDKPRVIADTPENVILATRGIDSMARRMMEHE